MRTLALIVALAAPGGVTPPVYVAATSGAWHGIVSSSGVHLRVRNDPFAAIAFAPDRPSWLVPASTRSIVVGTIGARPRTFATSTLTAPPVFGARGRIVYGSGRTIRVLRGPTIRPTLLRGARIVQLDVWRSSYLLTAETGDGRNGTLASALYFVGGGKTRLLVSGFDTYSERPDARFSPDGTKVAFMKGGDVWVVPARGGAPRRITSTSSPESDVAWSPDGTRLAYTTARHGVNEVYVATLSGVERRLTHTKPHPRGVPQTGSRMGAWSPDGKRVAVITYNTVGVVPAAGGAERIVARVTPERTAALGPVAWPS